MQIKDDAFWEMTNRSLGEDSCWEYKGYIATTGYGQVRRRGLSKTPIIASRYAMYLSIGRYPERHEFVCHSCDNPKCCNPKHLFLGSAQDNARDMVSKKRNRGGKKPGFKHGKMHRLSLEELKEIRNLIALGYNNVQIASKFNITHSSVSNIRLEKTWKNVK